MGVTPKPNGQELLLFLIEVALEASCPVYFVSTRKIKKYNRIIITIIVAFENVRFSNSNPPRTVKIDQHVQMCMYMYVSVRFESLLGESSKYVIGLR